MAEAGVSSRRAALELLSCAALTPALWSVLVFDADMWAFEWLISAASRVLATATDSEVRQVRLGSGAMEDALWSAPVLRPDHDAFQLVTQEGMLAPGATAPEPRLVVVADLTRLSLAATRASVMLTGAEVAHVERHGQQRTWQPRLCWLAGCTTEALGRVSPHLLDRFALRVDGRTLSSELDRTTNILNRWGGREPEDDGADILPSAMASRIRNARGQHPRITPAAVERVLAYFDQAGVQGFRRPLALSRLARAWARLTGAPTLTSEHVDQAARLIGLSNTDRC